MGKQNHNIAERKGVDEKLRENEVIYQSLFEEFRDALYITTREGRFVDVNQSMSEFFGYTKDEMMGLSALELYVKPGDRTKFQQAIEQTGSIRDYEVKLRHKDGTEMDCLLTSTVRKANDGSILGYQGVIREVTEPKREDEELSIGEWMSAKEWMGQLTDYIHEVTERKRGEEELSIGEWMSAREWMTKLKDYTESLENLVEQRTLELEAVRETLSRVI